MCRACWEPWTARNAYVNLIERASFWGCPRCGRCGDSFRAPGGVVAVLDPGARPEPELEDEVLHLSWAHRPTDFGFDRVLVRTTDAREIESFTIAAGNRPEPLGALSCRIEGSIPANARAVLEATFGRIEGG